MRERNDHIPLHLREAGVAGNSSVALLIVLAAGLVVAIFMGYQVGKGEFKTAYVMCLVVLAFPALLMLGNRYWAIIPFAMTVSLPAIPIVAERSLTFAELWAIASVGAFLLRAPLEARSLKYFRWEFLPICMYVGWAVLVWKVNGAGLAILGASTVGGRSYVRIGLAFAAFLILVNQRMSDKHAKWITFSLLGGAIISTVWDFYSRLYLNKVEINTEGFYSWHQSLSTIPFYFLAYVFSRHSLQDLVLQFRIGWMGMVGVSYGVLACSGKRAALGACLFFPMFSALVRRQYASLITVGTAVIMMIIVLVEGHGRIFDLPPTVQRVLWIFPGQWDYEVRMNTSGTFRSTLNRLAVAEIRENPIIGRGFGFTSLDAWLASDSQALQKIQRKGDHYGAFIMAAAAEWHSTWLGISATFGIPAAVIWALIWIQIVWNAIWVYRQAPKGSYVQLLAMMILMLVGAAILRSMTSGQAASNLMAGSWQLGILLSAKYTILSSAVPESAGQDAEEPVAGLANRPGMPRPQMGRELS